MPMFKWTDKRTGKVVQRTVPKRVIVRRMSSAVVSAEADEAETRSSLSCMLVFDCIRLHNPRLVSFAVHVIRRRF